VRGLNNRTATTQADGSTTMMSWELPLVAAALALAVALRPWQMLRHEPLRHPWLACLVVLPWLWSVDGRLPGGVPAQLSMAALLVLMFGWPLAVVTAMLVAGLAAWIADPALVNGLAGWWRTTVHTGMWSGVLPASLALLAGLATRRWLPHHLMVYILARGFGATLLAMAATGALWVATQPAPPGSDAQLLLVARWLVAWGDAMTTGMLTAIFVAFRPQWLATYSDGRYLPVR